MQSARIKSDLQGQALQRFTDKDTLRERLERETGEKVDMFEDRVDTYDVKVQKSRTYILDSCDIQIADQYVETYDTAVSLQSYLNDQYSTQGMS